jgi:hypothetical protein
VALAAPARVEIVHAVPGRLRLRVPALRGQPALADQVVAAGLAHRGVRRVRVNPACASIVVECDAAAYADLTRNGLVHEWVASPPPAVPPRLPHRRSPRSEALPCRGREPWS